MSESFDGQSTQSEPARRGSLVIEGRAVRTIAEAAALEIVDVVKTSSPLNPLNRGLSRAGATTSASHTRITMTVATTWNRPLFEVAAQVRDHVAQTVERLTGMAVDLVNVDIASVAAGHRETSGTKPGRNLQ